MARKRGKGGNRTPRNPAAVSGPGALARRTDGGAGQPIRVPKDQAYGARQESVAAQKAAPLAATEGAAPQPNPAGGGAAGAGVPGAAGGPAGGLGMDTFGPTRRPNESSLAGAMPQQPPDADMLLRILYQKRPTPYLARLLRG